MKGGGREGEIGGEREEAASEGADAGTEKPAGLNNGEGEGEFVCTSGSSCGLVPAWHKHTAPSTRAPFKRLNCGPNRLAGKQSAFTKPYQSPPGTALRARLAPFFFLSSEKQLVQLKDRKLHAALLFRQIGFLMFCFSFRYIVMWPHSFKKKGILNN